MKYTLTTVFVAILLCCSTAQATTDSLALQKEYYQSAKQELEDMLDGKKTLSFERAIFLIENAYWENTISYSGFVAKIENGERDIRSLWERNIKIAADSIRTASKKKHFFDKDPIEKRADILRLLANHAIYTYLTDTIITIDSGPNATAITYRKPYRYSYQDPLGTGDWKNTQVVNLLDNNTGNCFALASLFKIYADRLQTDAVLCTAPSHIYIQHADENGIRYNVELSNGMFAGTGTIATLTYTTNAAIKNNLSLRELGLKQSVALCLVYLGIGYEYKFGKNNQEFAFSCAQEALKYDSLSLNAMLLKAEILEKRLLSKKSTITTLRITKEFAEYQSLITSLYDLGYREMPLDMKNILIKGWAKDTLTYLFTKNNMPEAYNHSGVKNTRYASLSWGLFDEEIKFKPIEKFGQTMFDAKSKKIIKFEPVAALYNNYNFDPVAFAWNIDPLAKSFPSLSPYIFAQNSPIAMIDKQGMHGEIVITKTGSSTQPQIAKVDVNVLYYTTLTQEKALHGDLTFYDKAKADIAATYGRKTFTGTSGSTPYSASFNVTVKAPLQNEAELKAVRDGNPVSNILTFNAKDAKGKPIGTAALGGNWINYASNQKSTYSNTFAHEVSHTLGERGDWDNGQGYMSNYSNDRNVQDAEVNEFLSPAIQLANQVGGDNVIIHFFSGTNEAGEIGSQGSFNTYKVYDQSSGTYTNSITTPEINPQPTR